MARLFLNARPAPLGLTVTGFGHHLARRRGTPSRRTLDCAGLVCLVRGRGTFASASVRESAVGPGDVFLLFPGEWHAYGPETTWEEFWFLFRGPMLDYLRERGMRPARALFPGRGGRFWPALLRDAEQAARGSEAQAQSRMSGLLFRALNELLAASGEAAAADDRLARIEARVRGAPEQDWDFRKLAAEQGISYSLLRRDFPRRFGASPNQYLIAARMKLAAARLAAGLAPHQVAYAVGIRDPYYFSRQFKQVMGASPRNFQRFLTRL